MEPNMARWSMTGRLLCHRNGVFQVKFFRQGHIELDGAALPGSVEGIADMEVDFRSIKGAVAFIDPVVAFRSGRGLF